MDASIREKYVKAGSIAGRGRDYGVTLVEEGKKLLDVAVEVEAFIAKHGAKPAFPCCLSINDDAAHYTPAPMDDRRFARGDVVKVDCGVQVDGYIGDTAATIEVGTEASADLLDAARAALAAGLGVVRSGVPIRDIAKVVEEAIRGRGLRPVANLTGHSVDHYVQHAGLSIPSVAATAHGNIPEDVAVAIEPFATRGIGKVRDAGPGHIWHFEAARPQRDPLAKHALKLIQEKYAELPFAERWIAEAVPENKIAYAMRVLARSGAVREYPVLREAGNGLVAQFEHTVLVESSGVTVTTRTT